MAGIEYRMFLDNRPASRSELDRVEEITVEQEVDMAWEARIGILISVDEKGNWRREDEDFVRSFARARVEIRTGQSGFVPLIDGPVVEVDAEKHAEPGRSLATVVVQDDSQALNRVEDIVLFEELPDHEIAVRLYKEHPEIATTYVEEGKAPVSSVPAFVIQHGTPMQLLRSLAKRQGMHAYVLPGENPGQSTGCFRKFATQPDGLPELVLLGAARTLETFKVTRNRQKQADTRAASLRIKDKTVVSQESGLSDLDGETMGDASVMEGMGSTLGTQILPPSQGESVDLGQAVKAKTSELSYALYATGEVRDFCYSGVLQPYRVVSVKAGGTTESGDYLITSVTHSLTRWRYGQSFSATRNALSDVSAGAAADLIGKVF